MSKSAKFYFNKKTEETLRSTLRINNLNEVLEKKFKESALSGADMREKSKQYNKPDVEKYSQEKTELNRRDLMIKVGISVISIIVGSLITYLIIGA